MKNIFMKFILNLAAFCLISLLTLAQAGTLDSSFGDSGIKTLNNGTFTSEDGYAMALQKDGKIILGGDIAYYVYPHYQQHFFLTRFNANGTVDKKFGSNGSVITDLGNVYDIIYSVTVLEDGSIIAVGQSGNTAGVA